MTPITFITRKVTHLKTANMDYNFMKDLAVQPKDLARTHHNHSFAQTEEEEPGQLLDPTELLSLPGEQPEYYKN